MQLTTLLIVTSLLGRASSPPVVDATPEPVVAPTPQASPEAPGDSRPPATRDATSIEFDLAVEIDAPDLVSGAAEESAQASGGGEAAGVPSRKADVRLVISGGLDGLHDGLGAFYRSTFFRSATELPARVEDAGRTAIRTPRAVFFSETGALDESLLNLAAAAPPGTRHRRPLFIGPSALAFALDVGNQVPLTTATGSALRREMSAVSQETAVEVRVIDGTRVVGLALDSHASEVSWPASETPLTFLPAARASLRIDNDTSAPFFLLGRRHGSTSRAFGVIDRLLTPRDAETAYVDVGGALTSAEDARDETVNAMATLLAARTPSVLAAGRSELVARASNPDAFATAPYILAADGVDAPSSRVVQVGNRRVLFVAIGGLGNSMRALLPPGAKPHDIATSMDRAHREATKANADVVVAVAFSKAGESAALKSNVFDAVLHLSSSKVGALPAQDIVDLRANHARGLHAGATLGRISPSDVTELSLWINRTGHVEVLRIKRHAIVGEGPEAADAVVAVRAHHADRGWQVTPQSGLVARGSIGDGVQTWTGVDLTRVLGALVREKAEAELSILAHLDEPVAVSGHVPMPLARTWFSVHGRLRRARMSGEQLSKIFSALSTGSLNDKFYVNGGSRGGKTVNQRPIVALEVYDVVFSADLVGALQSVGVSLPPTTDDDTTTAPLVGELVETALLAGISSADVTRALAEADGNPEHAFFAELADISLSTSFHQIRGNEAFGKVRDSRVLTPDYWALGINGRATFAYDGPLVYAALIGTSQFSRQEQSTPDGVVIQEARDQLLFEGESRLLVKRLFDTSPRFTPEPGIRVSYQTEWTPNLVESGGIVSEQARRSELRGFAGVTLRPTPIFNEVRAGLILENDFASQQEGALEWGGEAALRGGYDLWILRFTVDGFVRGYVPDPAFDTEDDLMVVGQAIGRVELPAFWGLRIGMFADAYLAMGKVVEVRGPATSLIVGASLSYAHREKWRPWR